MDRVRTQRRMTINAACKTKTITVGINEDQPTITLKGSSLEAVESYSYLGSPVWKNGKADSDVESRLKKAFKVCQKWRKAVLWSKSVSTRQRNQVACLSSDGDVCAPLWSRDMDSDSTGA